MSSLEALGKRLIDGLAASGRGAEITETMTNFYLQSFCGGDHAAQFVSRQVGADHSATVILAAMEPKEMQGMSYLITNNEGVISCKSWEWLFEAFGETRIFTGDIYSPFTNASGHQFKLVDFRTVKTIREQSEKMGFKDVLRVNFQIKSFENGSWILRSDEDSVGIMRFCATLREQTKTLDSGEIAKFNSRIGSMNLEFTVIRDARKDISMISVFENRAPFNVIMLGNSSRIEVYRIQFYDAMVLMPPQNPAKECGLCLSEKCNHGKKTCLVAMGCENYMHTCCMLDLSKTRTHDCCFCKRPINFKEVGRMHNACHK